MDVQLGPAGGKSMLQRRAVIVDEVCENDVRRLGAFA